MVKRAPGAPMRPVVAFLIVISAGALWAVVLAVTLALCVSAGRRDAVIRTAARAGCYRR
jgi:hypothetical protein